MFFFYFMVLVIVASVFLTIKKKRPIMMTIPVFTLIAYLIVEIALVPAPFLETVKFIFSLR